MVDTYRTREQVARYQATQRALDAGSDDWHTAEELRCDPLELDRFWMCNLVSRCIVRRAGQRVALYLKR